MTERRIVNSMNAARRLPRTRASPLMELRVPRSVAEVLTRLEEASEADPGRLGELFEFESISEHAFRLTPPSAGYETPRASCVGEIEATPDGATLVRLYPGELPQGARRVGVVFGAFALLILGSGIVQGWRAGSIAQVVVCAVFLATLGCISYIVSTYAISAAEGEARALVHRALR
jgi:hypothetical protein